MATQTGQAQIEEIEGNRLRGWFKSDYEQNVYEPSKHFGAIFLKEAWEQSGKPDGRLAELLEGDTQSFASVALMDAITSVSFDSPNDTSTFFDIEVTEPEIFDGLEQIYWESYMLG